MALLLLFIISLCPFATYQQIEISRSLQQRAETKTQENDYLSITTENLHDIVSVGDRPRFICSVAKSAVFLLDNPVKWEHYGRDGSKKVISTLGNVETGLHDEFDVYLQSYRGLMTFTLIFKQGMKKEYDGTFKCVIRNWDNDVIIEKQIEVDVQ